MGSEDGGNGSDGGTAGGSTEAGEADSSTSSDDGSTADSGESSESSTGVDAPGLCGRGAAEPLAVAVTSEDVRLVLGDGSSIALELDPLPAPEGAWVEQRAALRGSQIAVAHSWTLGIDAHGATIGMFDEHGVLQWRNTQEGAELHRPAIGDDGSVVVGRRTGDSSHGALFDGERTPLLMPDRAARGLMTSVSRPRSPIIPSGSRAPYQTTRRRLVVSIYPSGCG